MGATGTVTVANVVGLRTIRLNLTWLSVVPVRSGSARTAPSSRKTTWMPWTETTCSGHAATALPQWKQGMRKTTRLKSGWGFGQTNSPLITTKVLIDAVGLCLLRVSEVWRLFASDLRRRINSFSGSDFKPRLVYKTWYFCYFFTNFDQQFKTK